MKVQRAVKVEVEDITGKELLNCEPNAFCDAWLACLLASLDR